jgi:hypothetical protein
MEIFCRRFVGAGGRRPSVRLEIDGPVVEEFELSLWLAVGRDFWHDTSLVMTLQFTMTYFRLLS